MTHVLYLGQPVRKPLFMHIVWLILKIIGLYLLLRGLIITSYRQILLNRRKKALWLIVMAGMGLLLVACLAKAENAPALIGWSSFLAIISIIPNSQKSKQEQLVRNQIRDARFKLMGVKEARKYFNWGFVLFAGGVAIAWLLFLA